MTFHYDPSLLGTGVSPSALQIKHYNSSTGQWETPPQTIDTTADTITVTVTSFSPFMLGGTPSSLVWSGQASNVWDTSTANWNAGWFNVVSSGTEALGFDDSAGTSNVVLSTTVQPQGVTFANNTLNYALSGSGSIVSSGGFTKIGTGSLNLGGSNHSFVSFGVYQGAVVDQAAFLQTGTLMVAGSDSTDAGTRPHLPA